MTGRLLVFSLLLATAATAQEIHRWVDAEGRVHFGDRPPLETKTQVMGNKLPPLNQIDSNTSHRKSNPLPAKLQRQYEAQQRQKQQQAQRLQAQKQAQACFEARQRLRNLKGRVRFIDANGREVRTSERERQSRVKQVQREIGQYCR